MNISLALVAFRVLQKKPSTGKEGMIGKVGIALETFIDAGKISVNGEIWQAESDFEIQKGEKVKIVELTGLTLEVEKI